MDLTGIDLNQLPHHLDVALFWLLALGVGAGGALGVRKLADAMARTDAMAARRAQAQQPSAPARPVGDAVAQAAPANSNAEPAKQAA